MRGVRHALGWGAQAIHDAIAADQPLDIRSGDVVLLDHSGSPEADHIQMVESYDPATRHLTYIDGNGGGYVVDNASDETKRAKSDNNAADTDSRHTTETATGRNLKRGAGPVHVGQYDLGNQPDPAKVPATRGDHVNIRVFGIGRPSIVDFEDHRYDSTSLKKPPTIPPPPTLSNGK